MFPITVSLLLLLPPNHTCNTKYISGTTSIIRRTVTATTSKIHFENQTPKIEVKISPATIINSQLSQQQDKSSFTSSHNHQSINTTSYRKTEFEIDIEKTTKSSSEIVCNGVSSEVICNGVSSEIICNGESNESSSETTNNKQGM